MFDRIFYWLGAKSCAAVGIVTEFVTAQSICTRQQTWSFGAVLFGAALLFVGYWIVRRRR